MLNGCDLPQHILNMCAALSIFCDDCRPSAMPKNILMCVCGEAFTLAARPQNETIDFDLVGLRQLNKHLTIISLFERFAFQMFAFTRMMHRTLYAFR